MGISRGHFVECLKFFVECLKFKDFFRVIGPAFSRILSLGAPPISRVPPIAGGELDSTGQSGYRWRAVVGQRPT
jgi:hypothetical protein